MLRNPFRGTPDEADIPTLTDMEAPTRVNEKLQRRTPEQMETTLNSLRELSNAKVLGCIGTMEKQDGLPPGITMDEIKIVDDFVGDVKQAVEGPYQYVMQGDSHLRRSRLVYGLMDRTRTDPEDALRDWDHVQSLRNTDTIADWGMYHSVKSTERYLDSIYGKGGAEEFFATVRERYDQQKVEDQIVIDPQPEKKTSDTIPPINDSRRYS